MSFVAKSQDVHQSQQAPTLPSHLRNPVTSSVIIKFKRQINALRPRPSVSTVSSIPCLGVQVKLPRTRLPRTPVPRLERLGV
ncbi:hypothetical protein A4X06_0g852 [Tilletia controversa]|uniref:Uncharacterized protein n=1 Tax=Tilletia controversa TaxID=13291 RepID=A0A8X7MZM1_9BASI|nr:hypothetical protein A4X06_0g852 [Tilletia controversa]